MRKLPAALLILALVLAAFLLVNSKKASAQTQHLVISEVQIGGVGTGNGNQDFVEIYNPTSSSIALDGMRLGKKTSGTTSATIIAFPSGKSVPAHGFFLWCNTSLALNLSCDVSNGGTVANNNSLALINGSLASGLVVDAVTFGTSGTTFGEGTSITGPALGTSAERKANSSSTPLTMAVGGIDEFAGNGQDTDNNASDFVSRSVPQPQNSSSSIEPPITSPTPTPSVTPTLTPIPTPTNEPTATPSPTTEPSSTPTPTLMPTASPTPTAEPTNSPTPTLEPRVTPSPTSPPTPTVSPTFL